ncbi:MAG TPA: fasciclin domain-containing protein [Pseudonocardiaceae bacterium]
MRKIQRLAAIGALAVFTVTMTACASDEEPATGSAGGASTTTGSAATTTEEAMGDGMTTADDVFGSACASVPTSGEGSLDGMVDDPVATAASNNPLLKTLVSAVGAAGLGDTLNSQEAITVFAPADPAFAKIPPADLNAVLADKAQLTTILTYHVVPERLDKDGILEARTLTTLEGRTLTVAGSGDAITVNGANVLCGNIPTANATVFVIDTVMMPTG